LPNVLNFYNSAGTQMIPTITYSADGEGRVGSTSVSGGQNPLASASYKPGYGLPTNLSLGLGDSDAFGYDVMGRMNSYQFKVGSQSVQGTPTWNANGTLSQLAIIDPINSSNQQTCNYGYDGLARLASANCGSKWGQTFSDDAFGNLQKTGNNGGISYQPTYNPSTNRYSTLPVGSPGYDSDGNLTGDGVNTYTWDADGNSTSVSNSIAGTTNLTFDAFDRMVEQYNNGSYTQIVYGPGGGKFALMNGQTLAKAFVPLPGGDQAVYNSAGLAFYRHVDWLGSVRLDSSPSGTVIAEMAYAPYGECYAGSGTPDCSFAGMNQDTLSSGPDPLYDALYREQHPTSGRWISPDPAGLAAADPTNPQSWNRYAYVVNNPLALVDPLGLQGDDCSDPAYAASDAECGTPSCSDFWGSVVRRRWLWWRARRARFASPSSVLPAG
jgi:RHS repeat-associated protein